MPPTRKQQTFVPRRRQRRALQFSSRLVTKQEGELQVDETGRHEIELTNGSGVTHDFFLKSQCHRGPVRYVVHGALWTTESARLQPRTVAASPAFGADIHAPNATELPTPSELRLNCWVQAANPAGPREGVGDRVESLQVVP
jgi:hypothetical protein